jgi:hypothetical protein
LDASGNAATCAFGVTVAVGVAGLASPMAALVREGEGTPPLPSKAKKGGSTIPLELQIFHGSTAVTAHELAGAGLEPPRLVELRMDATGRLLPIDGDDDCHDSAGLFRHPAPRWVFPWNTPRHVGGTGTGVILIPDGLRYRFKFRLDHQTRAMSLFRVGLHR